MRLLCVILWLIWPLALSAQTAEEERDRTFLSDLIESNLSSTAQQVLIDGFRGALSSRATIRRLSIADAEGVWLVAEGLALDWTRSALLQGRLEVNTLTADRVSILRPPVAEAQPPSPEAVPFALPDLPVSVQIGTFSIAEIVLGAPLLGTEYRLSLTGTAELAGGAGSARVTADRLDGPTGQFLLDGAYDNATRVLSIDTNLTEAADGIVANLLGIPDRPSLILALSGTAPIDDYDATLRLTTDGVDRISGGLNLLTVAIPAGGLPDRQVGLDVRGDVTPLIAPEYRDFFGPDSRLVIAAIRRADGSVSLTTLDVIARTVILTGAVDLTADGWPSLIRMDGAFGAPDGAPVQLPVGGEDTFVESARLSVRYDQALGNGWTGTFNARNFTRPGVSLPVLTLAGSGTIAPDEAGQAGAFSATLTYLADQITLDDAALQIAVGANVDGTIAVSRDSGTPLQIDRFTLNGPGLGVAGGATIFGPDQEFRITADATLRAVDLGRFAALAGLDLGGEAALGVQFGFNPITGVTTLALDGTTDDLTLGIAQADPYLAGPGTLTAALTRDPAGTRLTGFRIATAELDVTGSADITSTGSVADLDLTLRNAGLALPGLTGPLRFDGRAIQGADGNATLDGALTLTAATAGVQVGIAPGGLVTLAAEAMVPDLSAFAAVAGVDLQGAAVAQIDGALMTADGQPDLRVTATTTELSVGIAQADALLGGTGNLGARITRDTAGLLTLGDLSVTTTALALTGRASLGSAGLDADLALMLDDLGRVEPGLTGPATLDGTIARGTDGVVTLDLGATGAGALGTVQGHLTAGVFDGEVSLMTEDIAPIASAFALPLRGGVVLTGLGRLATDGSAFDLQVNGSTADLALGQTLVDALLAGTGAVSVNLQRSGGGPISINGFNAGLPALAATADGQVSLGDSPRFDGTLRVTAPDLGRFGGLARRDLSGGAVVTADGALGLDLATAQLALTVQTTDLGPGIPGLVPLFAGQGQAQVDLRIADGRYDITGLSATLPGLTLTGAATLADGGATGQFDLTLPDTAVVLPGLSGPATITGSATRAPDGTTQLTANATLPGGGANVDATLAPDLSVTGNLRLDLPDLAPWGRLIGQPMGGGIAATVTGSLTTDLRRFDLTLDGSARNLTVGSPTVATLLRGQGTFAGRFQRGDGGGLSVEGLRIAFPNFGVSGTLQGAGAAGEAQFTARLADIGLFTPEFSGPVTATGTARRSANGVWQLATDATGPGGTSATISGTVTETGQLGLSVVGNAPLGLINGLIEPRRLAGTAGFALQVNGPPQLSSVSGTITLQDTRVSAPTLGQALSDLSGQITLNGGRATLALNGTVQTGGQIAVTGGLGLAAPFNADISVALQAVVLRDPALYETTANGTVTLRGPLAGGATISGVIDLGVTEVQVPSSGVGSFGDLPNVVHVGPSGPVSTTLARAGLTGEGGTAAVTTGGVAYPIDLTINATRVFVRGRGLDAELAGSLRVTGTTANVIPAGQFSLIRGRLDILQQRFTLTDGNITLQGGFVPYLRLVASTEARTGTEIDIIVEGPANAPTVTFQSRPELPQDEVLAQLLFGRDITAITPLQAVQLAAAVGTLAGRGGGGIIANLRESFGVDDLDVATDDQGNLGLRVGTYLTDNLYTDVTVGTVETEINLNLDITSDITARGSVSSSGETSLGIFFERDY